jgi:hypothetical protein
MIAFRKEGSITIAKNEGDAFALADHKSQPDENTKGRNYNPPVWIDDQTIVYDAGETLYRFDLAKNNAKKIADVPGLQISRTPTMAGPFKGGVLVVVQKDDQYEVQNLQL